MATAKRTTRGATRSAPRQGLPASVLLGTGFIAGVICSVLVFQATSDQGDTRPSQVAGQTQEAAKSKAEAEESHHQYDEI